MDREQLNERVGPVSDVGIGCISGYQFRINTRGVATIIKHPQSEVYGVVWELSDEQLLEMDGFEGVAKGLYHRTLLPVQTDSGILDSVVYIAATSDAGQPRPCYLERIIAAARSAQLPPAYLEELCIWTLR
jgi:hypothetical protein